MASDAIGELVDASAAIYCRTFGAFRGWRKSSRRPTPAEFRAECEEQQRYLDRFRQALDKAKAVFVLDIVSFDERHRRIERIENLANQNARCNFHWERHRANSPELNEWDGDIARRIRTAAGQWIMRVHGEFRDEINWWDGLRSQLVAPSGEDRNQGEEKSPITKDDALEPFAEVRRWLENPEAITGKGRRILQAILDADGSLPLADMVQQLELDWDPPYSNPFNKQQQRINEKLERDGVPYYLSRVDNRACLIGRN